MPPPPCSSKKGGGAASVRLVATGRGGAHIMAFFKKGKVMWLREWMGEHPRYKKQQQQQAECDRSRARRRKQNIDTRKMI